MILLLIAGTVFLIRLRGFGRPSSPRGFFTVDDGRTLFLAPDKPDTTIRARGREAVRARVDTCDRCKMHWVAYLVKYTPAAHGDLRDAFNSLTDLRFAFGAAGARSGELVKRPSETEWICAADPRAEHIRAAICPQDDPPKGVRPVVPRVRESEGVC